MKTMGAIAVLTALLLAAPPAPAQSAEDLAQAKSLAVSGMREFQLGNYADALDQLQRAFKIKPVPALLFNVAQCHRLLGNLEQARRVYRAYINAAPKDEPSVAVAKAKIAEIDAALKAQASAQNSSPRGLAPSDKGLPATAPLASSPLRPPAQPAAPPPLEPAPMVVVAPPQAPAAALLPPVPASPAPGSQTLAAPAAAPSAAAKPPAPAKAVVPAAAAPAPAQAKSNLVYWIAGGAAVVGVGVAAAVLLGGKSNTVPEPTYVFNGR